MELAGPIRFAPSGMRSKARTTGPSRNGLDAGTCRPIISIRTLAGNGQGGRNVPRERVCAGCGESFVLRNIRHRHCSEKCWGVVRSVALRGVPKPGTLKVERPSYQQLMAEVASMSILAIGRKYGVSDNAVRKWIRWYEYEHERNGAPSSSFGNRRCGADA